MSLEDEIMAVMSNGEIYTGVELASLLGVPSARIRDALRRLRRKGIEFEKLYSLADTRTRPMRLKSCQGNTLLKAK